PGEWLVAGQCLPCGFPSADRFGDKGFPPVAVQNPGHTGEEESRGEGRAGEYKKIRRRRRTFSSGFVSRKPEAYATGGIQGSILLPRFADRDAYCVAGCR